MSACKSTTTEADVHVRQIFEVSPLFRRDEVFDVNNQRRYTEYVRFVGRMRASIILWEAMVVGEGCLVLSENCMEEATRRDGGETARLHDGFNEEQTQSFAKFIHRNHMRIVVAFIISLLTTSDKS